MITTDMLTAGYSSGLVNLIPSPYGDGIVCSIGDNWFYFGGSTAEMYKSVEAYKEDIPEKDIIEEILMALESFRTSGAEEFIDEYQYYEAFLRENLPAVE